MPIDDDTYGEIRDADKRGHPVSARLRRARQLLGGQRFEGADGEEVFRQEDLAHAEAKPGIDYVATAERATNRSRAAQTAAAAGRRLHDAAVRGRSPGERRRRLDAEIAKLSEGRDLTRPAPGSQLRALDEPGDESSMLDPELQSQIIDRMRELHEPYEQARQFVLEAVRQDADPAPAHDEHADTRQLDKRIRDRLAQLGRPKSDYQLMLEVILAADPGAAAGIRPGPLVPVSDPGRRSRVVPTAGQHGSGQHLRVVCFLSIWLSSPARAGRAPRFRSSHEQKTRGALRS